MLSEDEILEATHRMAAGRLLAMKKMPYYSTALLACSPHQREGLGTIAVDKRWRVYYDPEVILTWNVHEVAAAWLHEVSHVVREHNERFENLEDGPHDHSLFNASADASINSDLRDQDVILPDPDKRFYAEPTSRFPQWERSMTAEQLYFSAGGGASPPEDSDGKAQGKAESDESSEGDPDESEDAESATNGSSPQEDDSSQEDTADEDAADEDAQGEADNSEPSETESSGKGQDAAESGQGDDSSSEEIPLPDCGSAVGGEKRDYEETNDDDGSVDEVSARKLQEQTAKEILEYDRSHPGSVPGGLVRDAKNVLEPQVDWRREFAALVRKVTASKAGKMDYSYQRPSRRSSGSSVIFPALRQPPPPDVVIVLDTSGSMDERAELALALAEMQVIIDGSMQQGAAQGVRVINCDAEANVAVVCKDLRDFKIIGGGGTDMRIGLKAAAELRPMADAVVLVTDGGTPWLDEPPAENPYATWIALIVGASERFPVEVPSWMQRIDVKVSDTRFRRPVLPK